MIFHIDCNNFYASCERVFRPDLRGCAIVVLSNNDGCVIARSNEAKSLGIKMGTPFYKIDYLVETENLENGGGKLIKINKLYLKIIISRPKSETAG